MAKRKTRRKTMRRRRSTGVNLLNLAEMYVTTNIMTEQFAGVNPIAFITGQEYGVVGSTTYGGAVSRPVAQYGYAYRPSAASVTLPELLGVGSANFGDGLQTLSTNFKANFIPAATSLIATKIGFKIAKKITSKQRSFINNKVLQPLQLKSMVTV